MVSRMLVVWGMGRNGDKAWDWVKGRDKVEDGDKDKNESD